MHEINGRWLGALIRDRQSRQSWTGIGAVRAGRSAASGTDGGDNERLHNLPHIDYGRA
jgi:hypothetical protein